MKKLFAVFVIGLVLLPGVAWAGYWKANQDVILTKGQSSPDDYYAAGGSVTVAGDVAGDLLAAGGSVFVSGTVLQDAMLTGGQISVFGNVRDDVRAGGGSVFVSGTVGDDLAVAGGQVHLLSGSSVAGNVLVTGGKVILDGQVGGEVIISGGDVTLNGTINRNVKVRAGRLTLGAGAVLLADLSYTSGRPADIDPAAQIRGRTEEMLTGSGAMNGKMLEAPFKGVLLGLIVLIVVAKFFMYLAAALVMFWLLRRHAHDFMHRAMGDYGHATLTGFLVLVAVPVGLALLATTLVGLPLAFLFGLVYLVWLLLADIVAPVLLGMWLYRKLKWSEHDELNWKVIVLGYVVAGIAMKIPVAGFVLWLALVLPVLGTLALTWHKHVWQSR